MSYHLIVVTPFADFARGAHITDQQVIKTVVADHSDKVVKVAAPAGKE